MSAREIVRKIRNEIEKSKNTHIWRDYVNSLNLISQVVFTRSSSFILELIQNAEDAGRGLDGPGDFHINISKQRIKLTHNGRSFTEENVKALCGIRSSKKPEEGTLGYLGIGFKSVFKVTDSPEIYSGDFQFKFDRNECEDPKNTPWQVMPVWLDRRSESINPDLTTFILPFRSESDYKSVRNEVIDIRIGLYLFLRWLQKITVEDEDRSERWHLENVGETEDGIRTLKKDSSENRFKFFRRTCHVPEELEGDRLVQEYRRNVTQREIVIAFAIDQSGNLSPEPAGTMYGGIYSFLPLAEATSGALFPIQADFLVQPGREAVAYESRWNHWLVEQITELCKEAIEYFRSHPEWKFQFLPVFEFTRPEVLGDESYEKLFKPKLIEPLEDYIRQEACIPTTGGGWARPSQVVRFTEDESAADDLVEMGILATEEIAPVLGGVSELKLVAPEVKERSSSPIKRVDRRNVLNNVQFLDEKCKQANAPEWFRSLYLWLLRHPERGRSQRYHDEKFVLTVDNQLHVGGSVRLLDLPGSHPLYEEATKLLGGGSNGLLHPDILGGAKGDDERKELRGFLLGCTGVQVLNEEVVCKDRILPRILTDAPKPLPEDLVKWTRLCQQILGEVPSHAGGMWVLAKEEEVMPAERIVFSKEFGPPDDWETNKEYVPGSHFLSLEYVSDRTDANTLDQWRRFFKAAGVREKPTNGEEDFAIYYAMEKLTENYKTLTSVENRNSGYDLEGEKDDGTWNYIEVKGRSGEANIELTVNETRAADEHRGDYFLCVVPNIPQTPCIYMVPSPADVGEKEKVTVPIEVWKRTIYRR